MPAIKPEIIAAALLAGLAIPLFVVGSYYTAFFVVWWSVIVVRDVKKSGRIYPYEHGFNAVLWIKNGWAMIGFVYFMWLVGVMK